jgi:hypothetical protein
MLYPINSPPPMVNGLPWPYGSQSGPSYSPMAQMPTSSSRPIVSNMNWISGEKKMSKTYIYPDGSETDARPTDGQICSIPGNTHGDFSHYEWDDEFEEWFLIPAGHSDPSIIDKAKEIMKIGKYFKLRPEKKRFYWNYDEYELFPYANAGGTHTPYGPVCGVTQQYKSIIGGVSDRHHGHTHAHKPTINCDVSDNGTWYVPCNCGAIYEASPTHHQTWCDRFGKE